MTIKKMKIKTKKTGIIYNQGWVVIDANYVIRKEYCELDDSLLQNYIDNDKPFVKDTYTCRTEGEFPKTEQLVPKSLSGYTELFDTGLVDIDRQCQPRLFHNLELRFITGINNDYYKVLNNQNIVSNLRYFSKDKLGGICVVAPNDEIIGYVMPVRLSDTNLLHGFLLYYGNKADDTTRVDI